MELSIPKIKKFLIFQEGTFQAQKILKKDTLKKFLIFQEMEISSPKLKKLSYFFLKKCFFVFQEENCKEQKTKKICYEEISYISSKKIVPHISR